MSTSEVVEEEIIDIRTLYPLCFERIERERRGSTDSLGLSDLFVRIDKSHRRMAVNPQTSLSPEKKPSVVEDDENAHNLVMSFVQGGLDLEDSNIFTNQFSITSAFKKISIYNGSYKVRSHPSIDKRATDALRALLKTSDWKLHHLVLLLENGADPNINTSKSCETPLHLAISRNDYLGVKYLLAFGANVNSVNSSHHTPLMLVCSIKRKSMTAENNAVKIVKILLNQKRINLYHTDNHGKHAVMLAIENNLVLIIRELLLYGVEVTSKQPPNISPYDLTLLVYARSLRIDLSSIHNKIKHLDRVSGDLPRGSSSDLRYLSLFRLQSQLLYKPKMEVIFTMIHHKKLLEDQFRKRQMSLSKSLIRDTPALTTVPTIPSTRKNSSVSKMSVRRDEEDFEKDGSGSAHSDESNTSTNVRAAGTIRDSRMMAEREKKKHLKALADRMRKEEERERHWVRARTQLIRTVEESFPATISHVKLLRSASSRAIEPSEI